MQVIRMMQDHGTMPDAGGLLDQSAWWIAADRFVRSERARLTDGR